MAITTIYFGVARPAAQELAQLRAQIRSLEQSVALVAGQKDAVDETNHLLSQLTQQQAQVHTARRSLLDLKEMTSRLVAEAARVQEATVAINQLASIKDLLLANADGIGRAADALNASEELQQRLVSSTESNEAAMHASLDLLALRGEILRDQQQNAEARSALRDLVQLRSTLDNEATELDLAHDRVRGLIALKNSVLAQTNDLSDSIETLELTSELGERFRTAVSSFQEMRDWMIEIIALEPTFAQVQRILAPMTEMVNLKRMDPTQLRDFARAFVQQSQDRLASKSKNVVSRHAPTVEETPSFSQEAVIE